MKLDTNLDDLVDAFQESDIMNHFFLDIITSKILYINEASEFQARKKLNQLDNDRYLPIPSRNSQENFFLRELFVYQCIRDDKIAEKFHQALERKKPFKNFNELIRKYPELNDQWFTYEYDHIKNEVITWLCEHNIELINQQLIPEIKIRELTKEEIKNLPGEIKEIGPVACLHCHNKQGLKARFFTINVTPENRLIEQETDRIMNEKYGISHHSNCSDENHELLTASRFPSCGSEELFWDY